MKQAFTLDKDCGWRVEEEDGPKQVQKGVSSMPKSGKPGSVNTRLNIERVLDHFLFLE
jgi:hypothetical protein